MTPIDPTPEVFREKCADAYLKSLCLSMQQLLGKICRAIMKVGAGKFLPELLGPLKDRLCEQFCRRILSGDGGPGKRIVGKQSPPA